MISDGFKAQDFHRQCDNKGATLTIIRSRPHSHLFGGYSPLPWDSSSTFKKHPDTFVFTLTNPHNIPPTKYAYDQTKNKETIFCTVYCGPLFGNWGAYDILVSNESNQNKNSFIDFPVSFVDTTGHGNNTFTGEKHFTTNEIEVYLVT
jgi:TLD